MHQKTTTLKNGLDYFPLDVHFSSNDKIIAVAVDTGFIGELIVIKLLFAIYRQGYFIEWNRSSHIRLLKELPGVSAEMLDKVVSRLVEWDFFDKDLFNSAHVFTSFSIQQRYFKVKRWPPQKSVKITKTGFFATETGVFAAKTLVNDAGSTQNKEKKRKDSSLHSESMSDCCPTNKSDVIEDYDAFVAYFNEAVSGTAIQRIRVISAPRKRLLDARCKEYGKGSVADVIKKAAASSFLNGSASEKFVATFDWLIRPSNFLKTLEGNYDNHECINANQTQGYGAISNNGYRSREDVLTGAANIIRELREEARLPETELPVV